MLKEINHTFLALFPKIDNLMNAITFFHLRSVWLGVEHFQCKMIFMENDLMKNTIPKLVFRCLVPCKKNNKTKEK